MIAFKKKISRTRSPCHRISGSLHISPVVLFLGMVFSQKWHRLCVFFVLFQNHIQTSWSWPHQRWANWLPVEVFLGSPGTRPRCLLGGAFSLPEALERRTVGSEASSGCAGPLLPSRVPSAGLAFWSPFFQGHFSPEWVSVSQARLFPEGPRFQAEDFAGSLLRSPQRTLRGR